MRFFIKLSYNGKHYHGWQIQKTGVSIEEVVEKALSILLREPIKVIGAGRTDAGVHAKEMFAHFDFNHLIDVKCIERLNAILPRSIKIWNIFPVKENAHARFDAISRSYEYCISMGKNPFLSGLCWEWFFPVLDSEKMNQASEILMNYDDFGSFCKSRSGNKTNLCKLYHAYWSSSQGILYFHIKADRFLRNMVRASVGTGIDVGRGKIDLSEFIQIIESKDRKRAGASAPAEGLFLRNVSYPKDIYL